MSLQQQAASRRSLVSFLRPGMRLAAAFVCAASVAACAANSSPATSARGADGNGMAVGVAGVLSGQWVVTDVHPSGRVDLTAEDRKALVGRSVVISDAHAEDVSGRVCEAPSFQSASMSLADAMGTRQPMAGMGERVTMVDVSCATIPFGRYVILGNGIVLGGYHGTWVSLQSATAVERASAMVAPSLPLVVAPHTPEATVSKDAMEGQHAKPKAEGQMGMHLASYRGEGMAREGWDEIKRAFPTLSSLVPVYKSVVLGGKGTFVRLYATGLGGADMEKTCAELRKSKQYCVVMPVDSKH